MCINQQDKTERSQQVSMMGAIFRQAKIVHIRLGPEGLHTKRLFEFISQIPPGEAERYLSQVDDGLVEGIRDILSRSWWSRLWVVQEAVVASRPLIHCGRATTPFRDPLKSLMGLTLGNSRSLQLNPPKRNEQSVPLPLHNGRLVMFDIGDLSHLGPSAFEDIQRSMSWVSHQDVTDPRDRIYALLGFLPSSTEITPDYNASVEDTYRSSASRLMRWSCSLSLLVLAGMHETTSLPL